MPSMGYEPDYKGLRAKHLAFAAKMRRLGIVEGSSKWLTLEGRWRRNGR